MKSSRPITLFWQPPPSTSGRPSSFVVSIVVHLVAVVVVFVLTLRHAPRIDDRSIADRYAVRYMDLRSPEPQLQRSSGSSVAYPGPKGAAGAAQAGDGASPSSASKGFEQKAAAQLIAPQDLAPLIPAPQTLVQPDVPPNVRLPWQNPMPSVLMWSAENTLIRRIIPPPPREAAATIVRPSLEPPNHALTLADLRISPTAFLTQTAALPPSTTSPVVVRGPQITNLVPETTSRLIEQPTPARVLSISELRVLQGSIALPLANQVSSSSTSVVLASGRSQNSPQNGNGSSDSKRSGSAQAGDGNSESMQNGTSQPGDPHSAGKQNGSAKAGDGNSAGKQNGSSQGGDPNSAGNQTGSGAGQGSGGEKSGAGVGTMALNGSGNGPGPGSGGGFDSGAEPSADEISLPKDGKFGVVVVGSSLAEEYPETVGIWSGRLAYTVYLHVGLARNWILQYSLPRDADAAVAGKTIRPEAPWPYHMVRPRLVPGDLNADALMIHGFVNATGHFEHLTIVFPPEFAQSKFVLSTLEKWQFRPAMQNGQNVAVEMLLIIPDQPE
jgi:hypothetical protein